MLSSASASSVFPGVGLAARNAESAVELFGEQNAREAVRQGQAREAEPFVGGARQLGGYALGAADDEGDDALAAAHPALQALRELGRAHALAVDLERDDDAVLRDGLAQGAVVLDLDL